MPTLTSCLNSCATGLVNKLEGSILSQGSTLRVTSPYLASRAVAVLVSGGITLGLAGSFPLLSSVTVLVTLYALVDLGQTFLYAREAAVSHSTTRFSSLLIETKDPTATPLFLKVIMPMCNPYWRQIMG